MKVRHKIQLLSFIIICTIFIGILVTSFLVRLYVGSVERQNITQELMNRAFHRSILLQDFLSNGTDRAITQYYVIGEQVLEILEGRVFIGEKNAGFVSRVKDNLIVVDESFAEYRMGIISTNQFSVTPKARMLVGQIRERIADNYSLFSGAHDIAQKDSVYYLNLIIVLLSIIVLFVLIAFIFFVYVNFNEMIMPLGELLHATRKITEGELAYRANINADNEVGELAGGFNTMAETLSFLYKNMEDKIEERTKDLETKNNQLEKLNKFMVGRELKMTELKQEIEKLKKVK